MEVFLFQSPDRKTSQIESQVSRSIHKLHKFPIFWAASYSAESLRSCFEQKVEIRKASLQIGWREASIAEIACGISHQLLYEKIVNEFLPIKQNGEWYCILEDDVTLEKNFSRTLENIEELKFDYPVIITLFSRGKRFANQIGSIDLEKSALYPADFPPGQTCFYVINQAALKLATNTEKIAGIPDWPIWSKKCKFYLSFPWSGHESALETTIPTPGQPRHRYWIWRLSTLVGFEYLKWRKVKLSYPEYFYFIIRPWLLRLLMKLGIYREIGNSQDNSIWLRNCH